MSRRMSVSMTIDAVRARTKTVTRRHIDTWKTLKPGERLTLIEKGMGLAKGEKQVVICDVEVTNVRIEKLGAVTADEVRKEGLADQAWAALEADTTNAGTLSDWFVEFWCAGHGYGRLTPWEQSDVYCRRIEWRYLDEVTP